jgi:hypothetical protein
MKLKSFLIPLVALGLFIAFLVSAQLQCRPNEVGQTLCNPLGNTATNLTQFIYYGISVFAGFTTLIPIVAVVFAGFRMITSRGNAENIQKAKEALTWAVLGFVLAVSSYIVIAATIKFIGADNLSRIDTNAPEQNVVNPLSTIDFTVFLTKLLTNFLEIVGLIAVLIIIFNGFRYITSAGNEEQAEAAKEGLKWSIGGIIIIVLAYVIIRATATFVGLR